MSRIPNEDIAPDFSDESVAAELFLRQQPDEEEDEEDDDDDEGTDDGYSV